MKILLFNRWDTSDVAVEDPGLKAYVNLEPIIVPRTGGRFGTVPFHKNKMSIVERFMNKLMIPGHKGKRHRVTSGRLVGQTQNIYLAVQRAFEIMEEKTKNNPVQILVKAVENAALYEEVAAYRMGGIIARKAVIVSPQRRLDIALRHISQGIYKSSFRRKASLPEAIASELIAVANGDTKTLAVQERSRIEKEAEGAR